MATEVAQNRQANEQADDQLIRRGLNGDSAALEILFARNNRSLYQTALRLLGNPEDAEDALQEGMLAAYRNLHHFEGRSQFSTWLTRIVINAALMRRRSRKARPAVSLDEDPSEDQLPLADRLAAQGPSPEAIYEGKQLNEMLQANLSELSPVLRTAFLLREVEGLSTGEAAKTLGVSENTLKARLWRARQQLAARLGRVLKGESHPNHVRTSSCSLGSLPYAFSSW